MAGIQTECAGERRKMALDEEDDDTGNETINVANCKPRKIPPLTWLECTPKSICYVAHRPVNTYENSPINRYYQFDVSALPC